MSDMAVEDYTKTLYDNLKSNYQLTEQETLEIRRFLDQQLADLRYVEQQIRSTYGSLLKDQADATCQVDDIRTVLAPLRRVPSEIWGEIFSLCLPTDRNAMMTTQEAPGLLGLVCKRWRDISITTQKLWTTIHVPLLLSCPSQPDLDTLELETFQSEAVKNWLDRSGNYPLSISISELDFGVRNQAGAQPGGMLMIDTLIQYSSRWEKLEVTCSRNTFMKLVNVPGEQCPLLESLSIKGISMPSSTNIDFSNAALLLAPRLSTLRLINPFGNTLTYLMGWYGIIELFLDSADPTTLVPSAFVTFLLAMCPMLTGDSFIPQGIWITEYRLPPYQFHSAFSAPALKEFKLDSEHIIRDIGEFPVVNFLHRCSVLEILILSPAGLHNVHITQALRVCPLITTLILQADKENKVHASIRSRTSPVSDELLQALTAPDNHTFENPNDYLCSHLQHFQCKRNAISDDILLKFIKSRTDPKKSWVDQLRTVTISRFYRRWTIDIRAQLTAEIENGLEINLQYFESKPVLPSQGMYWNDSVDDGTTLLKVSKSDKLMSSTILESVERSLEQSLQLLLKTNDPPSDVDAKEYKWILDQKLVKIAGNAREISNGLLLLKHNEISSTIAGFRTLLSPYRRLPVALWQKIFTFCLPTDHNAIMSATEAPMLLGTVCRYWRGITLSTPSLWASLHIPIIYSRHPPLSEEETVARSIYLRESVQSWLGRSGSCSLSLSVAEIPPKDGQPNILDIDLGTVLFNLLTQYSRRWNSFEFTGSMLLPPLLALTPDDVPILESLSIDASNPVDGSTASIFGACRLQILRLKNMSGPLLKYGVSWSNITKLFIACHGQETQVSDNLLTSDVILKVLSRCNKLVSCYLEATEDGYPLGLMTSINLSSLEKLTVKESGHRISKIWTSIFTPALKYLKVELVSHTAKAKPPMVKLLSRSPVLETLVFNPDCFTFQATVNFLFNAPAITTLVMKPESFNMCPIIQIEDGSFTNAPPLLDDEIIQCLTTVTAQPPKIPSSTFSRLNKIVKLLTPMKQSTSSSLAPSIPQLCPLLQNLEFGYSNSFSDEALLQFIQARTTITQGTQTNRLRSVKGEFRGRSMKLDLKESLEAEISAGFKLELNYSDKVKEVIPLSGIHWNYSGEDLGACEHCHDFQDHVTVR
ncbi:hypothetical protein C0995_003327 [Termitomyces sp. Mi166|nr:hypothetical protein C0995_003327 [Termitomyces sp. Mi166\